MPSIVDDFKSIRARADRLSGRDQDPNYKAGKSDSQLDTQQWASGGAITGRFVHNKRPANDVIEETAQLLYALMGTYTPFPNRRRPPFLAAGIPQKQCYINMARDLYNQGKLKEQP